MRCQCPATHNIPVIQIESKIAQINDTIEYDISERLKGNFGVLVSGVDIAAIEIDKASEGYRQLMAVTKDVTTTKIQAETSDHVERLRIQREEGQYAQHKTTQTANIGAFHVEKQTEICIAGSAALEQMGTTGGGSLNIATMMTSMAVGEAVGQNIAGAMKQMMEGIDQPVQSGMAPPQIPTTLYHVAVNGRASGPFDVPTLTQMAEDGHFTADSLVWKSGMVQWVKAGMIAGLKHLFSSMPPIPMSKE